MRISLVAIVERTLSGRLRERAALYAAIADQILTGRDDRAVSQRLALFTFAVRVISAAILYVSQVLLARWMGAFEYGIFVVVWSWAVILGGLACLGLHAAVLRFVPEYTERGQTQLLRGIVVGSRVQAFMVATVFAVIGGLGLFVFGDQVTDYYVMPLYLGAVTLPMLALAEIQDGLSRAFSWGGVSLWTTFIMRPLLILVFMGLALTYGAEANAITAMGAVIAAAYVASITQLVWLERRIRGAVPAGLRRVVPIHWIGIALPIFIVESFFFLLTTVDVLIVGRLMDPDQVGVYYAASKTLALVHFVHFAVRAGSAQRFSKYTVNGDRARLVAFTRDTIRWTFWPSLAMVAMLLLAGKPLLSLFGPGFASGYPLLIILSIGLLFRAAIGPAESLLTMAGQQGICAVVYTVTFLLAVALNFSLIPRLGLVGAATATTLALVAETIALYVVAVSRLGIHSSIVSAMWPMRSPLGAR